MKTNTKILAAEFNYIEGRSLTEVLEALSQYGEGAKVLAGGTDLLVKMKTGTVKYDNLIYIKKLAELKYIESDETSLKIGAVTTLRDIENNEEVKKNYSTLYEAVRSMAAVSVKNMGTIGGNLCNGSPAADTAAALLALDASLKLKSKNGERVIPVTDFFIAPGKTALEAGELLTEIIIPKISAEVGSSFLKLGRVSADIAKINTAVLVERSGKNVTKCRIAFGSVAATPIRIPAAEEVLEGKELTGELISLAAKTAADQLNPITDNRSTRSYRLKVSKVILEEAIRAAWQRTGGEL